MLRPLLDRVTLLLLLGLAIMAVLAAADPAPQQLPLVHADFPVCVTIHNAPLQPHTDGVNLYPRRSDSA